MINSPYNAGNYQMPSMSTITQEDNTLPVSNFYNNKTRMKKNTYTSSWYKVFSLIFLFAVCSMGVSAQSTAVATGDWNTTTSGSTPWSTSGTGTLPAAGNSVTVNTAITINAPVVNTVGAITIASGGKITLGASGVLNAASITIQSGGTLDMTAAGTINITGSLSNSGTYTAGAGVVNSIYFVDNFTRGSTTTFTSASNPLTTTGGTPSVTYTATPSTLTGLSVGTSNITMAPPSSSSITAYITAPFPTNAASVVAPFSTTLANNPGLVTWYATLRAAKSTAPATSGSMYSQVLAATSATLSSGNGYIVSLSAGSTSNKVQLSSYTGGITTGSVTAVATLDNVSGAQDYTAVKVTYNPYTQTWTLGAGNCYNHIQTPTSSPANAATPATGILDPTLAPSFTQATPATDAKYTASTMTTFGFHEISTSTNSNIFDNYYIMTSPIVNVTSSNTLTAPITPLTALSGFLYVQSTAGPSSAQSFYINSGAISNPVTVTVSNSANWEISKDGSTGWGSTLTYTPASSVINSGITNGNQVFVRLKGSLTANTYSSDKLTISSVGVANQTVTLSGIVTNLTTPTSLTVASNSDNRQNITWGTVSSNILVFASTSSAAYTPSGTASSVYTTPSTTFGTAGANTAFTSGGNTYYLVAAGSGSNVEVTGLTSGTTYYYQVFAYNGSQYTTAVAGTSTSATTAVQPVTGFSASNASGQSVLSWTNPTYNTTQSNYWDEVLVLASTSAIVAPTGDGSAYTANAAFGSSSDGNGGYVVYKGTGTGVTVTGLTNFTNYNYAVYVRHGSVWSVVASTSKMALPTSSLSIGDFISSATGNYNASGTWSVWNGTSFVSSPCTISGTSYTTPGSTNNVWIAGGYTVTNTNTTTTTSTNSPGSYVSSSSASFANCANLYVVNGTLLGTNSSAGTGVVCALYVSGTDIQVGANGVIGNSNTDNTYNGIAFYTLNSGLTKIDNYASQTGGSIDLSRLIIYQNGSGNPTLEIARNIKVHYHGSTNGGGAYGMGLQNTGSNLWTPNATITIDNGATVTMDKWSCFGPYIASTNQFAVNFTLNVNGTLTFTPGIPAGSNQGNYPYSNNGYLSLGSTIANTGTAGTGCYLHIGSTGTINTAEFYPNNSNGLSSSGITGNVGRTIGITIDNGGVLNIGSVADFSVAGGQIVTGGGSINFSGSTTYIPNPTFYFGSANASGINAVLPTGTNTLDGSASTYRFKAPTAWAASTAYVIGNQVTSGGNIYTVTSSGTSGTTAPSGTSTFTDVISYAYVSSIAQTTGTALPASVYGLSLSNAAGITLSGATTVTNTYTQTSTVLTAASNSAVLTVNSGVTQPAWSSTNYIAGPVQLYSAASSSAQTLNFPVGTSSEYLPLSLTFTQVGATATAYTVTPKTPGVSHGYTGAGNVQGVSSSRYYDISAAGNTFTNGSITMSYSANDDDNTISLADATNLRVAQYVSGSNWTNLGGSGSANVTGTISSTTAFSALGQFAIGNQTVSSPAPTFGTASGATVGGNYTIPYTLSSYDAAWQAVLLSTGSITYAGTVLTKNTDYTVSSAGITIIPNSGAHLTALRTAGTVTITVAATGYTTRTITQSVGAGTASKLTISTQPAASASLDGVVLATSPVVIVQDAYGNTVTSSSATVTAAVGTGSSPYFTIGGVSTAAASSGIATFTGITAINHNASDITGTITFTSGSLTPVTSSSITIKKPTTYYWVGTPGNVQNATGWGTGATTLWNTALNGSGTTPSGINSTDIYEVNGTNIGGTTPTTGSVTLKYSNNLSIGQLRITNGAQVTMSASTSATSTITIVGNNGGRLGTSTTGDVYVDGTSSLTTNSNTATGLVLSTGTSLVVNTGGTLTMPSGSMTFNSGAIAAINGSFTATSGSVTFLSGATATINGALSTTTSNIAFASGATATVNGSVTVGTAGGNTSIVSVDAGALTFNSGATCTVNVNSAVNAFGSATASTIAGVSYTAGTGSVVFANGSQLTLTKGPDVFGGTRNVTSFAPTSTFIYNNTTSTALAIDGHSFGNLTLSQTANPSTPGANGFACNNLNVNLNTFTIAQTGSINITGNISIASGCTLSINPGSALTVNLSGTSSQSITATGTFTLGANTTLNVNNATGVTMASNLTSTGVVSLTSGSLTVGANTLTVKQFSFGSGTLVAGGTSSIVYTGTATFAIPSTVSALNGLTISGASTVSTPSSLTSLATLTVSNASAVVNVGGAITLSGLLTNAGTISLGANDISLTAASTALTNSGTITSTTGAVTLASLTNAQSIGGAGTGTVANLTINGGHTVTVTTALNVTGKLKVTWGTLACGVNMITLKSTSITNSAIVDVVGGGAGSASITGTVIVERYIPQGFRAYRDMAPQVYGAGTINANWQEGAATGSSNPKPGYGIFITGPTAYPGSSNAGTLDASGFDASGASANNTQDYTFVNGTWTALANTKSTNLDAFTGYRLLVRGDRTSNIYTTPVTNTEAGLTMYNATTLRTTGNLVYGTVTYSSTGVTATANGGSVTSTNALSATVGGFSLVANPYVSPVLWGTGSGSQSSTTTVYGASNAAATGGINGSYWFLDPTLGASGFYRAYNALTGASIYTNATGGNSSGTAGYQYIQPGQAVFVQSLTTSPKVVFSETTKAATSTKLSVFGAAQLSKIYVSLMKQSTTAATYNRVDGAAVAFRGDFGNTAYGPQDALKFSNSTDNLSISDKGKNLSIDGRLPATASDAIPLAITKPSATAYQLSVDASNYISNGFEPMLYDAFKNTTKALGTGATTVDFTVDANNAASFSNRFTILFTPSALPVNSIVASASLNNKIATISWKTAGEKNVVRYEIEKSADAKLFTTIGQSTAKNTATASYTTTDNSVTATTYYRIKAVSTTGATSYSNVAKLSTDNRLPSYSLYPNPLKGGNIVTVGLGNVVAGKYTVSIYNALGQRVSEQTISHTGGSATHAISINNALAAGAYSVTISEAGSKQLVHQNSLIVEN